MRRRDRSDERQAKAVTFRRSVTFRARKPLEQPGRILYRDPLSVISNRQASNGVITLQLDANRCSRRGMAKGIIEEIRVKLL